VGGRLRAKESGWVLLTSELINVAVSVKNQNSNLINRLPSSITFSSQHSYLVDSSNAINEATAKS
jgi:hypothetical protein